MRADVFRSAWLQHVSPEVIGRLRDLSDKVVFEDRSVIYAAGAEQKWLWGVVAGQVRVEVALNEMQPTLGHIHHPGAWFGESEPLLNMPGLVEMAAAGETTLERIPFSRLKKLANIHPELWEGVARLTAMNQLLAMMAANDLALRTGRKRLAAALLRLAGQRAAFQGSLQTDTVKVSQQEISGLANLALSKVSVCLGDFAREQLIRQEYGRIMILSQERMLAVIDE